MLALLNKKALTCIGSAIKYTVNVRERNGCTMTITIGINYLFSNL